LGSLEALVKLLENKDFKVKKAEIGDVSEKDVKEAYVLKTKKDELGVILAFNVKVSPEAIDEAANKNIELFASNVIYKIIEDYMEWLKDSETRKRRKLLEGLQYPCKFTILRGYVFRKNNPAIVGVKIIQGVLKKDSFVMNKEGKKIGKIKGLQIEKKNVEEGKKGEELAVSIEGGNIGRNLFEDDELYTMVSIEDYKKLKKLQLGEEDDELLNEIFAMQKQAKE
jgi:translation initiation factor 5B